MIVVGLTGSIGTGKTTVAAIFASLGAEVIDADKIAHRLLWRNSPCFKTICRVFGKCILNRGRINRRKLAQVVFNDSSGLKKLEKIIHPLVIKEVKKKLKRCRIRKDHKIVVLDVPLLFESGMDSLTDVNIVVASKRVNVMSRLLKEGSFTKKEIIQRSNSQMPLKKKKALSDFVINNNSTVRNTKAQVEKIWNRLCTLKNKRG